MQRQARSCSSASRPQERVAAGSIGASWQQRRAAPAIVVASAASTSCTTSRCSTSEPASAAPWAQRHHQAARHLWPAGSSTRPGCCSRRPIAPPPRATGSDTDSAEAGGASSSSPSSSAQQGSQPQPRQQQQQRSSSGGTASSLSSRDSDSFSWEEFLGSDLPQKLGVLLGLIALSRVGVYIRLPGVDVDGFGQMMQSSGLLGYVDALSGGSISKVGLFSLGIIPYINASIVLQLLSAAFPALKKLQREEGAQGRARFQYYQKLAAFVFAIVQSIGQLTYIRPFVEDFSPAWLAGSTCALTAGAMALVYIADTISELKLGNGTSVLIFANIASALPTSVGALLAASASEDPVNVAIYVGAFFLTTLGIIYVQEAERRIPVNYSSRYSAGGQLSRQSYLPFKVNATGVMPLIFASSLLALPSALARYTDATALDDVAKAIGPGGLAYVPINVALIAFFNYYYTFLQLEPKDLAEQLKRGGAAIPAIRPGRQTAEYVTNTLTRMSLLGSVFLGALAATPSLVEGLTHVTALRGFAGTSVLIMVGVATDTARRIRAEQAMAKYQDVDKLYDNLKL